MHSPRSSWTKGLTLSRLSDRGQNFLVFPLLISLLVRHFQFVPSVVCYSLYQQALFGAWGDGLKADRAGDQLSALSSGRNRPELYCDYSHARWGQSESTGAALIWPKTRKTRDLRNLSYPILVPILLRSVIFDRIRIEERWSPP